MKKITQRIISNLLTKKKIMKLSNIKINEKNIIFSEVTEPLTISNNNGIPFYNGIYCEKIFGPIINFKCRCYKKNFIICDNCKILKTSNIIRRYKFGYIKLNSYFLNNLNLNYISLILNIKKNILSDLFNYNIILNYNININFLNIYSKISLIFYKILKNINLLNEIFNNKKILKKKNLYEKYNLLKLFYINKINLKNLLISYLPILPPSLRPIFYFNSNLFFLSFINFLYLKIISHNNKLNYWLNNFKFNFIYFIYIIIEKRFIQIYMNNLFSIKQKNENKKNLISNFTGKYNKFREQILGKRVDLSSRAVITSSTSVNINNIGIPISILLIFFNNIIKIIIKKLYKKKNIIFDNSFYIKFLLNYIKFNKFVLLNRAPTLHKLNLQSFYINIIENNSIKINPISCSSFNADFDGDQMSLFVPIFINSQLELKFKLNTINNIFNNISGNNIKKLTQSSIIGLNIINNINFNNKLIINNLIYFSNLEDSINYINFYCPYIFNLISIIRFINFKNKKYVNNFYLTNIKKLIYY